MPRFTQLLFGCEFTRQRTHPSPIPRAASKTAGIFAAHWYVCYQNTKHAPIKRRVRKRARGANTKHSQQKKKKKHRAAMSANKEKCIRRNISTETSSIFTKSSHIVFFLFRLQPFNCAYISFPVFPQLFAPIHRRTSCACVVCCYFWTLVLFFALFVSSEKNFDTFKLWRASRTHQSE